MQPLSDHIYCFSHLEEKISPFQGCRLISTRKVEISPFSTHHIRRDYWLIFTHFFLLKRRGPASDPDPLYHPENVCLLLTVDFKDFSGKANIRSSHPCCVFLKLFKGRKEILKILAQLPLPELPEKKKIKPLLFFYSQQDP